MGESGMAPVRALDESERSEECPIPHQGQAGFHAKPVEAEAPCHLFSLVHERPAEAGTLRAWLDRQSADIDRVGAPLDRSALGSG